MEVKDLLTYIKANKANLPTRNGVKDHLHKVFTAYVNLMEVPNATVYDVYYNIQGLYEAMREKYSGITLRNYTQALAESLNLPVIQDLFTQDQITEFQEQIQPYVEDAVKIAGKHRADKTATKEVSVDSSSPNTSSLLEQLCPYKGDDDNGDEDETEMDEEITICPPNTPIPTLTLPTIVEPEVNTLKERIKTLEDQNHRLREKVMKQKAKMHELRLDAKNTTMRLWNVLLASINANNTNHTNPQP